MMIFLRRVFQKTDWVIFFLMLGLIGVGFVMLISTSSIVGLQVYQDPYFFVKRTVVFFLYGVDWIDCGMVDSSSIVSTGCFCWYFYFFGIFNFNVGSWGRDYEGGGESMAKHGHFLLSAG